MTETQEIVVRLQLEYPPGTAEVPPVTTAADLPLLYGVSEAARLLAVGTTTVYEMIARGELESFAIGHRRVVTRAGIEAYIKRRLAEGGGDAP